MTELGLRARKKLQTRQQIVDTAAVLFAERGFDDVTVAEIARAANVSEKTVFNYFGTKEDLIFSGMDDFSAALLQAIRERPHGVSPFAAFGEFVVQPRGLLAAEDPDAIERLAAVARIIDDSTTLQTRQRQLFDASTDSLATLLAEEAGATDTDIAAWVVANGLIGVLRAMQKYIHRAVLAGRRGPDLISDVLAQGERAVEVLEHGLADYTVRR
ncbi:TetR/AcrR family transcriptional regulator [Nocardia sp. NBC_01009]|uniref:TetR/AcrR family transcriptional regulator n=1 Tax=Nocardia sp. NBC_01009 TaxID=2975996 RepID=UPI00386ABDE8|nr:TetR/AcrR family transcriptional regulator [Nocardia sp. NBC_01009]